jgi:4-hydroxy-3-methylbut-2-en-1-yl diphosphate synthase IspG/GcpE
MGLATTTTNGTTKKIKVETGEGHNVLNNTKILKVVKDIVSCPGCEEQPCVFTIHKENLVAYDEAEHSCLAVKDIPENNLRRKKLYRTGS